MRRVILSAAVGLILLPGSALTSPPERISGNATCGSYGTSVEFVSSPSEAARQAKQEEKLVFVLHVSGHFEDPKFT
ncbi:MAG TPA: hypothetical protein VK395_37745 [Gemmataceae bacterium]|nr:hypothetical protein [Gemmataceae bacterium]